MGFGYICISRFKLSEEVIPTTEEGWDNLFRKIKTNRKRMSHLIYGYISNNLVAPFCNEYNNTMLITFVFFYNHFCSFKMRIPELLEFINDNSATREGKSMIRDDIYGRCLSLSRILPIAAWIFRLILMISS